ncbi:hypothetical protein L208DRAFT_1382129 [Tricholoma matsutake]|nr:hypothetical protein L208DRAFT_1382129 [Tricholoma matsutake 945]
MYPPAGHCHKSTGALQYQETVIILCFPGQAVYELGYPWKHSSPKSLGGGKTIWQSMIQIAQDMPTIEDCVLNTLKTVASLSLDIDAEARSWFCPVPAIIPDNFFSFLQERAMGIAFGAPKPIPLSTLVPAACVLAAGQNSLDALQMSNAWHAEMDNKGNINSLPLDLKENGSPSPPTTPIQGALGIAPAASPSRHDMDMDIDIPGVQHSPQHTDMEMDSEENDILEEANTIPSDDNDEYDLAKDLADVFNEVIGMKASQEEPGSDRGDSEVASPRPFRPRKNKPRRKEDNGDKPYNPGATASQFKNLTETLPNNEIMDGKECIAQNSKNEVIDLTLEEIPQARPCLFQVSGKSIHACTVILYGPDGSSMEHTSSFHTKQQQQTLLSLHGKVQKNFINDRPPHLLKNNHSFLNILTENTWSGMSSTQYVIDIQDQSLEEDRVVPGIMQSLLNSHLKGDDGKSLFAHYLPGDSPHWLENTANSSQLAWKAIKGQSLCKDIFTHQEWASWCGAATSGALVNFPMDPDGLSIHLRLCSGMAYAMLKDDMARHEGIVIPELYSLQFSMTLLVMASATWEADAFFSRGSIVYTCRAMFHAFLGGKQSNSTEEAQLTTTEQGHIPALDTMDDCQQYRNPFIPPSLHGQEEIKLAQALVKFLTDTIKLMQEDRPGKLVSVDDAFVSYLILQGRWLMWQYRMRSQDDQDKLCCKLLTTHFLQDDHTRAVLLDDGAEEPMECFLPVNKVFGIGFPSDTQNMTKWKSIGTSSNPTKH